MLRNLRSAASLKHLNVTNHSQPTIFSTEISQRTRQMGIKAKTWSKAGPSRNKCRPWGWMSPDIFISQIESTDHESRQTHLKKKEHNKMKSKEKNGWRSWEFHSLRSQISIPSLPFKICHQPLPPFFQMKKKLRTSTKEQQLVGKITPVLATFQADTKSSLMRKRCLLLVGGFFYHPSWTYAHQNGFHFPKVVGVKVKKVFETTT